MALKIYYHKIGWKILHPIVPISKKDLANVSLKLLGAWEVCPSKLSRTENKLFLISACVWIIQKSYFISSDRFLDLKAAHSSDSKEVYGQITIC